jgi:DNA-directed RNA polymerase subunit RPC12/RpoP
MKIQTTVTCVECGRIFDLTNEDDAQEYYYGHDCETQ